MILQNKVLVWFKSKTLVFALFVIFYLDTFFNNAALNFPLLILFTVWLVGSFMYYLV